MGFSTTYGDTNLTHASLPKTEGDMWEPAFDLDFGVLPLAALPGVRGSLSFASRFQLISPIPTTDLLSQV